MCYTKINNRPVSGISSAMQAAETKKKTRRSSIDERDHFLERKLDPVLPQGRASHRAGHPAPHLNTVDLAVKTGNAMADAIINSKISLAKSRNIPVQIDAHIPVKLKMSELDLCCILGNLFDNAMDASAELPEEERLIRVYMDMKGTQLYISFTNFTATKKQKKLAGRFVTTKGEGHGFGLVRIDAIVEKLDGYLSRNSEDGAFTTEILIPQV